MKRIKYEEIQNSIQNYVKQRNLSASLISAAHLLNETEIKKSKNSALTHQIFIRKEMLNNTEQAKLETAHSMTELNLMALNDLVLIESSINDYYSFTFNTFSPEDYLNQFEM
jgi:hypothetical protein